MCVCVCIYHVRSSQMFQEDMATHQPNMDALNKIAKKRKAAGSSTNPEMTKKITSLYKRCSALLSVLSVAHMLHVHVRVCTLEPEEPCTIIVHVHER